MNLKKHGPIILFITITIWLRIVNLGYSDYQGDEIKALFLPEPGESISNFLLDQRKGPTQFIVTSTIKLINPSYTDEFLVRLPFAIAGILAIIFFYKFAELNFNKKIALYASLFLAMNGFLIAFSRIAQYQSFVIFFDTLALYFLSLASKKEKWEIKGIYLGLFSWSLSILSHYDGIFIAPMAFYLIYIWFKNSQGISYKSKLKHFVIAGIIASAFIALFYIPFIFALSIATKDYWKNRLSGGGEKISSSRYLFSVYHPIYIVHFYTLLSIFGTIRIIPSIKDLKIMSLLAWIALPLIFLEIIVNIPGTHIFNYLVPLTLLIAFGITLIEETMNKFLGIKLAQILVPIGLAIIFLFMFLQSNAVYVDHSKEYPWENEKFLIWEFHKPTPIFHLSMFGFPYFRQWEEIGKYVTTTENNGYYSTNERKSIARYFVSYTKSTDDAGHFIYIYNPQSFTDKIVQEKAAYWAEKYDPAKTFFNNGKPVVDIYYMQPGDIETIKILGY